MSRPVTTIHGATAQAGRNGRGNTTEAPGGDPEGRNKDHARERGGAGLRVEPAETVEDPVPPEGSATPTWRERASCHIRDAGRRLHACSPYTDQPASIRDVIHHAISGGSIPGDHHWGWSAPAYLWDLGVVVPCYTVGHAILWVLHKKRRVVTFAALCALLRWAGYLWVVQAPASWIGHLFLWLGAL